MKHFFFIFICIALNLHVSAQSNYESVFSPIVKNDDHFSILSSGLFRDSKGYIWTSVQGILSRYNGIDVESFKPKDYIASRSRKIRFHSPIIEDVHNNIWYGSATGLYYFNSRIGELEECVTKFNECELFSNGIDEIIIEPSGKILILSQFKVYEIDYDFNLKSKKLEINSISQLFKSYSCKWQVMAIDNLDNIWLGSSETLLKYNSYTKIIESSLFPKKIPMDLIENSIMVADRKGNIWVSTPLDGVFKYSTFNKTIDQFKTVNGYPFLVIRDMCIDKYNNIWLASGGGLFQINQNNGEPVIKQHEQSKNINSSFTSIKAINTMYSDPEGFILLGSLEGEVTKMGVHLINHNWIPTSEYPIAIYSEFCIIRKDINDNIYKIRYNRPYSSIIKYDFTKYEELDFITYDTYNDRIRDFLILDNHIWIISSLTGLSVYNIDTKEKEKEIGCLDILKFFKNIPLARMIKVSSNMIFITTGKGEIYQCKKNGDKWNWELKKTKVLPFSSYPLMAPYYSTSDNFAWIATKQDQILGFGPNGEEIYYDLKNYLQNDNIIILTISQSNDGKILIGHNNGILIIDRESNTFNPINEVNGVSIFNILPDSYGNLWLTTPTKILRYRINKKSVDWITEELGMPACQFLQNSKIEFNNGKIGFGTKLNGILYFDPKSIDETNQLSTTKIIGIRINSEDVSYSKEKNAPIINNEYPYANEILLKHDQNYLTIRFSANNFLQPENLKYSYIMEGVDYIWNEVGHQTNEVTYSNLSPGEYYFRVKSTVTPGIWLGEETLLKIIIKPVWYKTKVAYILYMLLTLGLVIFIYKQLVRFIALKNQVTLNDFKLKFFTNISHDLNTPLTLLNGPLKRLKKGESKMSPEREKLYDIMSRSIGQLTRLVSQVMDLRKLNNSAFKLKVKFTNISEFINQECHRVQIGNVQNDKTIYVHNPQTSISGWIDADILLRVLDNVLSNALKYSNKNAKIDVFYSVSNSILSIKIHDNGIGISKADLPNIFKRFNRVENNEYLKDKVLGNGIGLSLCKELVQMMKGSMSIKSQLGKGTQVEIFLPVHSSLFEDYERIGEETTQYDGLIIETQVKFNDNETDIKPFVLIVEDTEDMQLLLKDILNEKYKLAFANNGEEGLNKCINLYPDLIISDVLMPGIDGFEMVKKLKTDIRVSHIPVILLTALGSTKHKIEGLDIGADVYISKPFDDELLLAAVSNVIESRKKLREKFGKKLLDINASDLTVTTADELFLEKVMKIIEDRLSNPEFHIEEIPKEINLSRAQFFRKIKSLTNSTAGEFIRFIRLKKAALLLAEKNMRVSEVCYEVGFTDPKYFGKIFKKTFGCSPTEYSQKFNS